MGHDNLNCTNDFSCVNCKGDHPSYSRNCEKWIKEKEIQNIRTQQNITYLEARKIFESRTPTIGKTYAAVISKEKDKKYQSTGTQTDFFSNSKLQTVTSKSQPQANIKNSSKHEKETETSNPQKPVVPKLPLHKKSTEITSFKKQTVNQNQKLKNQKQTPNNLKVSTSHKNPPKKAKTTISVKVKAKNENSSMDIEILSLHPTDSSENEDGMSVASDLSTVDTFI